MPCVFCCRTASLRNTGEVSKLRPSVFGLAVNILISFFLLYLLQQQLGNREWRQFAQNAMIWPGTNIDGEMEKKWSTRDQVGHNSTRARGNLTYRAPPPPPPIPPPPPQYSAKLFLCSLECASYNLFPRNLSGFTRVTTIDVRVPSFTQTEYAKARFRAPDLNHREIIIYWS